MSTIKGKVQDIVKQSTAYGDMFNFKINGTTYGAGKFPPKGVEVGDYISFDAEQKGRYWNMNTKSVKKIDPVPDEAPSIPKAGYAGGGAAGYDARQDAISKQASRNTAIEFMNFLAGQDALPVAKTAKGEAKFDAFSAILDKLTEDFYNYATGKTKKESKPSDAEQSDDGPEPSDGW